MNEQGVKAGVAEGHPEDCCERCGGKNVRPWFAPNELWNKYATGYSVLCPACFAAIAQAAGLDCIWKFAPDKADELDEARVAELIEAAGALIVKGDGRAYFNSGADTRRFRAALARCQPATRPQGE